MAVITARRRFCAPSIGILLALAGAGCVPIPVPVGAFTRPPYPQEVLDRLSRPGTDKEELRRTLGPPATTRAAGRYWFYAHSRESVGFVGADLVIWKYEWVAIRFDGENRVVFLERNTDRKGCLSNGVCQSAGLFSTRPDEAVITAPTVDDGSAKAYRPGPGGCAVYLYLERLPVLYAGSAVFSRNGQQLGRIDDRTYLFMTHPRGMITVSAYQFRITRPCLGGEKVYVIAIKAVDRSLDTGKDLSTVEAVIGEAAIRARRLALPD